MNKGLETLCRGCLSTDENTVFLLSNDLNIMFTSCTNLEICENDGLPTGLCSNCVNCLQLFYSFKERCVESDLTLRNKQKDVDETIYTYNLISATQENAVKVETENQAMREVDFMKVSQETGEQRQCILEKDDSLPPSSEGKQEKITRVRRPRNGSIKEKNTVKRNGSQVHKHKYKCNYCPRRFKTEDRSERHEQTHFGKQGAECELCYKTFSSTYALEVHMNLHMGKKDFTCHCGKDFFTKYTYEIHVRTHDGDEGRTFVCEKCGKGFYSKANLMGHKMVHMDETPFQCSQCPKAFKNNGSLQAHLLRHSNVRNHICAECGKASVTLAELRIHMRNIHSDLRPFCCDICGKRCKLRSHLTAHMQIHTERNKCSVCSKIFATGGTLKIHQRVHTGEKPFKCDICERSFSQKSALKTHMKIHN